MCMMSTGNTLGPINRKTESVIIRKSECSALYFCRITHKTCYFIKLIHLAPKNDSHFGSVKVRKWNDQNRCRLIKCKVINGTFELWYFAGYTVHLILVQ